ncbi:heavy-metal-associated domain-containing protein [Actinomyces minihominis]|uniref:heavy-metal-associated domain-containing protein n=1 Tax=Actinomyces minihominis TaxID=2002838 RepID=UPI000C076396|nr:heavy-metal-associated domain-containing protein [Actinomyces minihominis]
MASIDRTTEMYVDGLTCGHCVASVTEELSDIPGVKNVEVILNPGATSRVTTVSDVVLDDEALRDAIAEAGFELKEIKRDF